jgi:hypothetical protein
MTAGCVTVDELERVRATRVEVSRLSLQRFREQLTDEQREIIEGQISGLVATLPQADQASWAEEQLANFGIELDWSILENDQVVKASGPDHPRRARERRPQGAGQGLPVPAALDVAAPHGPHQVRAPRHLAQRDAALHRGR